jgi:hypothetical protein
MTSLLVGLTAVNLVLGAVNLAGARPSRAESPGMLRGTGLQIVDAQGRVRASIALYPANATDR